MGVKNREGVSRWIADTIFVGGLVLHGFGLYAQYSHGIASIVLGGEIAIVGFLAVLRQAKNR